MGCKINNLPWGSMDIFWNCASTANNFTTGAISEYADQTLSRHSREVLTTTWRSMIPSVAQLKNTGADQVIAHLARVKRSMNDST